MGILWWKKKAVYTPSARIQASVNEARKYITVKIDEEQKKSGIRYLIKDDTRYSFANDTSHIRYSRRPNPDTVQISDFKAFLDEAHKDHALFESPAATNTYRQWERRTAVMTSFSQEVLRRIEASNTSYVDFYKRIGLDKKMFHKLKSDYGYQPSKETALRCCIGLQLTYEAASELLQLAGYSLSPSNSRDLAIRFCMEQGITCMEDVNFILDGLGEKPFD